ncbi:MAG: UvrD-helicase domain-containing protein, partial [Alloprevotella sp.]|nr:UvrD-helicase domain-containing protein [Alloprevotella sp.]
MNGYLSVYTASAGSGKTFTLAVNYVAHLLSGEPMAHRHILAVTFTNKATAEMKTRILAELWNLAHGEPDRDFVEKLKELLPGVSDDQIKSRAARALGELIHNYEDFHIETIDSFFQSVLASLARELGLTASYNLEIDDRKVIAQAVDHLMASLDDRPELLRRIMSYMYARIEDDKRWDGSAELTQLASVLTKEVFLTAEDKILEILNNEEKMKNYVDKLNRMKAAAINQIKKAAQQLDDSIKRNGGYGILSRGSNLETQVGKLANGDLTPNLNMLTKRAESSEEWFKKADRDKPANAALASQWTDLAAVLMTTLRSEKPTYLSSQLSLQYLNPLQLV